MSDALYVDAIAAIHRYVGIGPDEPVAELFLASVLSCFDPGVEQPRVCFVGRDTTALVDLIAGWGPVMLSKGLSPTQPLNVGKRILLASGHPDLYTYDPDAPYATIAACSPSWARGKRGPATLRTLRTPERPFTFYNWPQAMRPHPGYGRVYTIARDLVVRLLDDRVAIFATDAWRDEQRNPHFRRVLCADVLATWVAQRQLYSNGIVHSLAQLRASDVPNEADVQATFRLLLAQLGLAESRIMRYLASHQYASKKALRERSRLTDETLDALLIRWRRANIIEQDTVTHRWPVWRLTPRCRALADVAQIAPAPEAKRDVAVDDEAGLVV